MLEEPSCHKEPSKGEKPHPHGERATVPRANECFGATFNVAARLLKEGEVLFTDEHGQRWRATPTRLECMGAPVVEGDAFDVATALRRWCGP